MKMHHFALFFILIAGGFFVTAQTLQVTKMQRESIKKTEYDCLVAAVNATVETVFSGTDNIVTKEELDRAEEVFFQTLSVVRDGATDRAAWIALRERVPCLAVFEERGYYLYFLDYERGYGWTDLVQYEEGKIPQCFFEETEELLRQYHNLQYQSRKHYRMVQTEEGIWEQSIEPPCVFAIYAPASMKLPEDFAEFLYAASGRRYGTYYVTEDNYCHLPLCEECKTKQIVARYATQKESAEDGAIPCGECLKGED